MHKHYISTLLCVFAMFAVAFAYEFITSLSPAQLTSLALVLLCVISFRLYARTTPTVRMIHLGSWAYRGGHKKELSKSTPQPTSQPEVQDVSTHT